MTGGFFWASYVVLWLVVVLLFVLVVGLYRELGQLYLRTRGATTRDGPRVGTQVGEVHAGSRVIDVSRGSHILLFGLQGCRICEQLMAELAALDPREVNGLGLHLMVQTGGSPLPGWAAGSGVEAVVADPSTISKLRIRVSPFAILVQDGVVRAKGVVNNAKDLFGLQAGPHQHAEVAG